MARFIKVKDAFYRDDQILSIKKVQTRIISSDRVKRCWVMRIANTEAQWADIWLSDKEAEPVLKFVQGDAPTGVVRATKKGMPI